MQKPELLLPAGSPEALMAAIEGGADAVYLGLQSFNARNRAKNFGLNELPDVLQLANKHRIKIYVTLNTLVKNNELPKLLRLLVALQKLPISALIIQDWGVYWLIKNHFPKLPIHTSTQMGNHNSSDCNFAQQLGFERVILARELSQTNLRSIHSKSSVPLEIFAHGALCYSYSGYCLFSSWNGGDSANRGSCRQPCRQLFQTSHNSDRPFCMKDLQLLDYLPQLVEMGISSLKIEGRMRSAEYVYNVARAYRMALDDYNKIPEAKSILAEDGGRAKTKWRFTDTSEQVISDVAQTGTEIGTVLKVSSEHIHIALSKPLDAKQTLQIMLPEPLPPLIIKLTNLSIETETGLLKVPICAAGTTALIEHSGGNIPTGIAVIRLARSNAKQFQWTPVSTKLPAPNLKLEESIMKQIYHALSSGGGHSYHSNQRPVSRTQSDSIYIRIHDSQWLPLLQNVPNMRIICSFAIAESINRPNLIPELPLYIDEADLGTVQNQVRSLQRKGFTEFSLSRLSQVTLFQPNKQLSLMANEHIYSLNDAAIMLLKSQKITTFVSPVENDFPNLLSSKDRSAIIPLYFHPNLFFSKQAPDTDITKTIRFEKNKLQIAKTDSVYLTYPQNPVCLFNFHQRLLDKGFSKFLIDLSKHQPDAMLFQSIIENYRNSTKMPETSGFNFKKGLH